MFSELNVSIVTEDQLKSESAKECWRPFCETYKETVEDYNYATLIRLDSSKEYSEANSIIVPRVQFLAIELARNRYVLVWSFIELEPAAVINFVLCAGKDTMIWFEATSSLRNSKPDLECRDYEIIDCSFLLWYNFELYLLTNLGFIRNVIHLALIIMIVTWWVVIWCFILRGTTSIDNYDSKQFRALKIRLPRVK